MTLTHTINQGLTANEYDASPFFPSANVVVSLYDTDVATVSLSTEARRERPFARRVEPARGDARPNEKDATAGRQRRSGSAAIFFRSPSL